MEKFYVTTAIDYVNATPHIGHAYEKIAADILARYHRLRGKKVFFQTGVDEHGSKVEKSAIDANKTPKEFCDEMAGKFEAAWKKLNLSYDKFIRTTDDYHEKAVQHLFRKLVEKATFIKEPTQASIVLAAKISFANAISTIKATAQIIRCHPKRSKSTTISSGSPITKMRFATGSARIRRQCVRKAARKRFSTNSMTPNLVTLA